MRRQLSAMVCLSAFCLVLTSCGKSTVDFDAQKTVAFDKERDVPEKLGGPSGGGGGMLNKGKGKVGAGAAQGK
jgi:hypothetical protein